MTALQARHAAPPRSIGTTAKLYRDATSLASSSMLTALFGVAFWAVAAHEIPPNRLGVQTALLSAITTPALIVASGFGDAFTALLPSAGTARAAIVRRGYRLVLTMASIAGVIAAVVAVTFLRQVHGSLPVAAMVAVGALVWALFTVQDPALTSMGRAHWLPIENGSVSIAKVLLLPAMVGIGLTSGSAVVATLIPAALAVAALMPRVLALSSRAGSVHSIDEPTNRSTAASKTDAHRLLHSLAWRTTLSVTLTLGALTFLPFVVTATAGPSQGAVFALCLSITQSLDFVGAALGVSLVVHASAPGADGARMARQVVVRCAAVVGVGAVVLALAAPTFLRVMNPTYVHLRGVEVIAILCGSSFIRTAFITWSALQRSRRAMRPVLILNTFGALTLYTTLPWLCGRWGALGAAIALATAQVVLSIGAAGHLAYTARRRSVRKRRAHHSLAVTPTSTPQLVDAPTTAVLVESTGVIA